MRSTGWSIAVGTNTATWIVLSTRSVVAMMIMGKLNGAKKRMQQKEGVLILKQAKETASVLIVQRCLFFTPVTFSRNLLFPEKKRMRLYNINLNTAFSCSCK